MTLRFRHHQSDVWMMFIEIIARNYHVTLVTMNESHLEYQQGFVTEFASHMYH